MASRRWFIAFSLIFAALDVAQAAGCIPLRFGYVDQHRPPYYMGEGSAVPEQPGATVDLVRDGALMSGFGCAPQLVRLPPARLRHALMNGDIDLTALGEMEVYPPEIALPLDKNGQIDVSRAQHNKLMVLVRAKDKLPAGTQPGAYFKGKVLGAVQGNAFAPKLRELGLTIDDGARDVERNIEKLKLGRVDGVLVSTVKPGHVEAMLKRYGGEVVQLPQPLVDTKLWLAFNRDFYQAHREQAEAFWTWLDVNRPRLGEYAVKYRKAD
jgi:hypothetical protein